MFGSLLIRFLVTLVALLFGSRAFTLKYLLHPIQTDLSDLKELYGDGTVFVRRVGWIDNDSPDFEHVKHFLKQYWSLPLMPPILAFLVMLFVIPGLAKVLGTILLLVVVIGLFIAILVGFADGESRARIFDWLNTLFTKVDTSALTEEEIELLRCQPDKEITLATLPAHKKSIKLRFMATKSKICKPFAA